MFDATGACKAAAKQPMTEILWQSKPWIWVPLFEGTLFGAVFEGDQSQTTHFGEYRDEAILSWPLT